MKKELKQITGTSIGVTFTKPERKVYDMELGDIIDLSDMTVIKREKEVQNECSKNN